MSFNKHGLSRDIPHPVKREIRQNSGFGCILCGTGIYQYEHVDPEFHNALQHDPKVMTLLCPTHHQEVTSGMMAKSTVKKAMLAPYCKSKGYAGRRFDLGDGLPELHFAGLTLRNCQIPIQVFGEPLFEIKEREAVGAPFRLTGNFYDSKGNLSLRIIDNEWQAMSSNWDVEVKGRTITIREGLGDIHLQLTSHPPKGLSIDKLNMRFKGVVFTGNKDTLQVQYEDYSPLDFTRAVASNRRVGLEITEANFRSDRTGNIIDKLFGPN